MSVALSAKYDTETKRWFFRCGCGELGAAEHLSAGAALRAGLAHMDADHDWGREDGLSLHEKGERG